MHLSLVGGHLTPVYALAQTALSHGDRVSVIGTPSVSVQSQRQSHEAAAFASLSLPFYPLQTPKLTFSPSAWLTLAPRLYRSFSESKTLLRQLQPDVVLSFGAYVSVPVGLAAKNLGLPLIIHEQTAVPGLANRLLSLVANQVTLGQPQARRYFPHRSPRLVGNPLRRELFSPASPPPWFTPSTYPLLYLTGGSQGAQFLNQLVAPLYPQLLTHFCVIHQFGHQPEPDRRRLEQARHQLPQSLRRRLYLRPYLSPNETAFCLQQARLAVSRAGANTVHEITALGLPTLFIPLPQARFNEQTANLQPLLVRKACFSLPQANLTEALFLTRLLDLYHHSEAVKTQLESYAATLPKGPAQTLHQLCHAYARA